MPEYKSREFCRDIECGMQKLIDNDTELGKSFAKSFCRKECEAYKFHKWLQENNYKIVKGNGGENYE